MAACSTCQEGQGHWRGGGACKQRWQLICSVALNSWWTCEAQSPVKILINMTEAYWLEVKYAHCSRCWLAQNGAIMFDNVQCKPFNQSEVLFCWILNTGSILHVSSEFIQLKEYYCLQLTCNSHLHKYDSILHLNTINLQLQRAECMCVYCCVSTCLHVRVCINYQLK